MPVVVGWGDVARRSDLDQVEARLESQFTAVSLAFAVALNGALTRVEGSSRGGVAVPRFALLLYAEVAAAQGATREEARDELARYERISQKLAEEGVLRSGEAFLPASRGQRLWREGDIVLTAAVPDDDLELSGFLIVECDEKRALEIATIMPVASHGRVEVRPLLDVAPPGGREESLFLTGAMLDRAVGAVVGGAVGDALGAGYEFTTPAADVQIDMVGGGIGGFAPGEWTDDTAQAAAILRVLTDGHLDLEAIGGGFLEWFHDDPKDVGVSTAAVLRASGGDPAALRTAADDYFRSHPDGAAGNGSLMRTAPVAIAHLGDDAAIAEAARAVSRLTHGDPLAADACVLWCIAIDRAVRERRLDGVWDGLDLLDASARDRWRQHLEEAEDAPPSTFADNGFVVTALQAAHAAITQTPVPDKQSCRHLQHALEAVVRIGGDTDTVAAIAGQVLGAHWGVSAVPASWRRPLHGWPGWRYGELVRAAALVALGGEDDPDGWPSAPSQVPWSRTREPSAGAVCVDVPGVPGLLAGNLLGLELALERGVDAIVSLCRVGTEDVPADVEHVEVWLHDRYGDDVNPNLRFVLDDAADVVADLLDEHDSVYVHCRGAHSRTPTVVARHVSRTTDRTWQEAFDDLRGLLPVMTMNIAFTAVRRGLGPVEV